MTKADLGQFHVMLTCMIRSWLAPRLANQRGGGGHYVEIAIGVAAGIAIAVAIGALILSAAQNRSNGIN